MNTNTNTKTNNTTTRMDATVENANIVVNSVLRFLKTKTPHPYYDRLSRSVQANKNGFDDDGANLVNEAFLSLMLTNDFSTACKSVRHLIRQQMSVVSYEPIEIGYTTIDEQTKDIKVNIEPLTEKQDIILNKRLEGKGYKAIASELNISVSSVRSSLTLIQSKTTVTE